jgi:hypothetical protein
MTHFKKISLLLITTLLLGACIEDSSDDDDDDAQEEEGMGYFIDSPVQGLAYSSASHSGTTDEFGRYDYEAGETVTFKLGSLTLGSASAAKAIHVSGLFDDPDANDTDTVNLARLLLTLDSNADSDDGIQLSAEAISAANATQFPSGLDFMSGSFAADVANYLAISGVTNASVSALVSAQDAQEHIADTLSEVEELLTDCGNECVPRAAFNEFVAGVMPRHGETDVAVSTNIVLEMTADYGGDIDNIFIEIHGLPTSGNYENCRIDWSGYACDGYPSTTIYNELDVHTLNTGEVQKSTDNKTVTINPNTNLKSGYEYTIHVFNDGDTGFDDDYKTWWKFITAGESPEVF